jgi:hypothetical protein
MPAETQKNEKEDTEQELESEEDKESVSHQENYEPE